MWIKEHNYGVSSDGDKAEITCILHADRNTTTNLATPRRLKINYSTMTGITQLTLEQNLVKNISITKRDGENCREVLNDTAECSAFIVKTDE